MKPLTKQFWLGVKDLMPLVSGILPFGLIAGATGVSLGMTPEMIMGMTLLFFAGSAQLASYSLIQDNAPFLIILLTVIVINLRFAIYSASFSGLIGPLRKRYRFPLAYMLSDQVYGLCQRPEQVEKTAPERLFYLSGVASSMLLAWIGSVALGIVLGSEIPPSWSLEFTIPLAFLTMLVGTISNRRMLLAAIISASAAIIFYALPYNLGFLIAVGCGVLSGYLIRPSHP
ncbi:AzlC family ABC transporter permease [Neptuniibacter halophilus]|uniref:AzlC family ABC transporter permease n=1 Tax=Neptuniibacter halophilus TaxID=651666 RepID=UPI0025736BE5|nr:AzlC family ABC transporter permease [Neptuniibacter halophilus]